MLPPANERLPTPSEAVVLGAAPGERMPLTETEELITLVPASVAPAETLTGDAVRVALTNNVPAATVQRIAQQNREPVATVRKKLTEDGTMDRIASHIQTEKTLNFLFDKATKVEPEPEPEPEVAAAEFPPAAE